VYKTGVVLNTLIPELIIDYVTPVTIGTLVGQGPENNNHAAFFTVDKITYLK
jgi:hypothetical protein